MGSIKLGGTITLLLMFVGCTQTEVRQAPDLVLTPNSQSEPLATDEELGLSQPSETLTEGCIRDRGNTISALVGRDQLLLASLVVGKDGSSHPGLAAALEVRNSPRSILDGVEYPSEIELELTRQIESNECFRAFRRVVQEGRTVTTRDNMAVMQLEIPYSDAQFLEIEYIPGKIRRNYLFTTTIGLELRNGDGGVVFSKLHAVDRRQTCFRDLDSDICLDFENLPVDSDAAWKKTIELAIRGVLTESALEIDHWYDTLQQISSSFYDRRYGENVNFTAEYARWRDELAQPYLFIRPFPRVNVNGLVAGLDQYGYKAEQYGREELQNYYNILFRAHTDNALRENIEKRGDARNARILLLTDDQSKAFEEALIYSCVRQDSRYSREDCRAPVALVETLCSDSAIEVARKSDFCLFSSAAFGRSGIVYSELGPKGSQGAISVSQRIELASYLREPNNSRSQESLDCVNPATGDAVPVLNGYSADYLRVGNSKENDDRFYLMEAANQVLEQQANCLANEIVNQYQTLIE